MIWHSDANSRPQSTWLQWLAVTHRNSERYALKLKAELSFECRYSEFKIYVLLSYILPHHGDVPVYMRDGASTFYQRNK